MELRIRIRDIQWGALVVFVLYTVIVICFLLNEVERHAEEEQYAHDQIKLVWNNKDRADFFLSHDEYGNDWFQRGQDDSPLWTQKIRNGSGMRKHTGDRKYFLSAFTATQTEFHPPAVENLQRDVASLKQWIHYLLLAGVDHIYLCDGHERENHHLGKYLWRFMGYGVLTYLPMHYNSSIGFILQAAQAKCYKEVTPTLKKETEWLMNINMFEYPFVLNDQREGFLSRHLQRLVQAPAARSSNYTDVEVNYKVIEGPVDTSQRIVVDRGQELVTYDNIEIVAPLYRPSSRSSLPNPEHTEQGKIKLEEFQNIRNTIKSEQLLLLNYHNTVKENFFDQDRPRIGDDGMSSIQNLSSIIVPQLKKSLTVFGEQDAYLGT